MRSHARARKYLTQRASLSPRQEAALNAHLAGCSRCRQVAEEYARQDRFMRALDLPAATGLRERVLTNLAASAPSQRRTPRRLTLPVLAPTLVILLAVFTIVQPQVNHLGHGPMGTHGAPVVDAPMYGPQQGGRATTQSIDRARKGSAMPFGHGPPPRFDVSRTAYGLRLRLIVRLSQSSYAPNALLPVEVTVGNVSRNTIDIFGGPGYCTNGEPVVQVLDSHGTVRYPPPLPDEPIIPECASTGPRTVAPGHAFAYHFLVVLHGRGIRAVVQFSQSGRSLITPILHIPVASEHAPEIRLFSRPTMHIKITHLDPSGGPVFVSRIEICSGGSNFSDPTEVASHQPYPDDPYWLQLSGVTLHPACPHPQRWALVAGQIGHPTVSMDVRHGKGS